MEQLWKKIEEYENIQIFRHVRPDFDAFGSQIGLYNALKEMYPNKTISLGGVMEHDLLDYYPSFENTTHDGDILGIVVDTANVDRIDGDITQCSYIIKIDHHIIVDQYGDLNIVDEKASSASEVVTLLLKEKNGEKPLNQNASLALFLGVVGDTGRFMYSCTGEKTFLAASYLMTSGINVEDVFSKIYMKKKVSIKVLQFIYSNYKEQGKIAYYILTAKDLAELGISREEGSNYVNTFSNFEEFVVWIAITQNEDGTYRVSMRSRGVAINEVANQFHGGGHANASGASLETIEELPSLLEKLEEKING